MEDNIGIFVIEDIWLSALVTVSLMLVVYSKSWL